MGGQTVQVDLDVFAALVDQKRSFWEQNEIKVEFSRGPSRLKSAAWVTCEGKSALAQLIVWDSGEADLSTASKDSVEMLLVEHYEVTSEIGLLGCLEDLTQYLLGGT